MKRFVARLMAFACVLSLLALPAQPAAASTPVRGQLNGSADPTMTYFNGAYYLATTLGDRIGIWTSPTLAGLATAPERTVWRDPDATRNKQVWAPSIHRFIRPEGPRWYIYYTASDGVDGNHRNYVIESDGDNPIGPYHFKGRIADYGEYAIDGEPITHNGRMYFVWAGPGRGMGGPAQLYLRLMESPWTTSGNRVALPADGGCTEVREGPTGLRGAGRLFLVYSTCDTGKPDYQLWMKSIADGADPLVVSNWRQHPGPVFSRNDAAGVFGPGHNDFFRSPDDTQDWIVYHGKTSSAYTYDGRTTRAQPVVWNADGTPNFGRPLSLTTPQAPPSGDPWSSQEPGASRGHVADGSHYFDRAPDGTLAHWWRSAADGVLRHETWGGPMVGRPVSYLVGGEQHVFVRTPDGHLRHWWWAPGVGIRHEDWGAGLASDPTGMLYPNGQKHVFGRSADGKLNHWWQEPDGTIRRDTWGGGDLVGNPVAYAFGNEQHVFARGSDNSLRHWFWYPGIANNLPALDNWGIGAGRVQSDPTGFTFGDQQHVFYRTANGSVEHHFFDHGDWLHATDNWGGNIVGAPFAIRHGQAQQVFGRSADGTVWRLVWRPGGAVTVDSGGTGATTDPVALAWRDETHVFTRGADGALVDRRWQPAGGAVSTSWGGQVAP